MKKTFCPSWIAPKPSGFPSMETTFTFHWMDWSNCPDVELSPDVMSGAPVVRGTRVPIDGIIENAAEGFTPEQIVSEIYPTATVSAVRRILTFARTQQNAHHPA